MSTSSQTRGLLSCYAINCRILAAEIGCDDAALQGFLQRDLADNIQDEFAAPDETTSPEDPISVSLGIDNRLRDRHRERATRLAPANPQPRSPIYMPPAHSPTCPSPSSKDPMPAEIQSTDNCGQPGHNLPICRTIKEFD